MPKISSDNKSHFEFRKKFCNQYLVNAIQNVGFRTGESTQDVCYRFILEGVQRDVAKQKEIADLRRRNKDED